MANGSMIIRKGMSGKVFEVFQKKKTLKILFKKVFTHWWKTMKEGDRQISVGREFHIFGDISKKAISQVPIYSASNYRDAQNRLSEDDCIGWVGSYKSRQFLNYAGPKLYRDLKVNTSTLNWAQSKLGTCAGKTNSGVI